MVSPTTEDVLAWLKREEQDAKNNNQIFSLQAALANAYAFQKLTGSYELISYFEHIAAMYRYSQTTLAKYGVTVSYNPNNLYRPLGFGIQGEPGYFNWATIQERFGVRGPQKTGTFNPNA